jgi:hypothetical protein
MGIHPERSDLPSDFHFTYFLCLPTSGVFEHGFSVIRYMVAAGTRLGSIALFGEPENSLKRVGSAMWSYVSRYRYHVRSDL